ncbi:secreted frizzled-related protein 3-like isoform X1 [Ruditapes philippinarum]|uniref:secreted frizzled-related protein 3-like isoform X1 n=1 Tax=Ruditapes philippinarum TaxID=129788 RepID=UPI00295BF449|nr:secreted frizzled-related protein 3-like isoform X1 [Ruditapes philippinarum]
MFSVFDAKSSSRSLEVFRCSACEKRAVTSLGSQSHTVTRVVSRSRAVLVIIILGVIHTLTVKVSASSHRGLDMCEPIEIPLCMGMPYNMTRMPNHLHHSTQENARLAIEPYGELLKQNCSADLLFFLCAMFAPICTPHFQKAAIPPCRSVCERSKRGCEPLMNKYNFSWPADLDCNLLPEYDKGVCVSPEAIVSSMPTENAPASEDGKTTRPKPKKDCKCTSRNKPTKKAYKKGKYDFAIGCMVKRITTIDENNTVILVVVDKILQRGKVHLQERREIDLWADSQCVCPALKVNRQYLIIGEEEVLLNRLKFSDHSLVTRWKQKWEKKFKRWSNTKSKKRKKGKNRKNTRCKKGKCRKNNSKEKVRCRVEQKGESSMRMKCVRTEEEPTDDKLENSSKRRRKNKDRRKNKGKNNPNSTGK